MKLFKHSILNVLFLVFMSATYSFLFIFTSNHLEFLRLLPKTETLQSPFWNAWSEFIRAGNMKYIGYLIILLIIMIFVLALFKKTKKFDEYQISILTELLTEIIKTTSELLNEKNYQFSSVGINPTTSNPIIEIRIEGTKEYFNAVKAEISLLVADAVSSKTNINFDVKVNRRSENEIRDEKWHPIFTTIREETDKKFEEYNGFAYSFHPEPLQIITT